MVSWVKCGTRLYRLLIFVTFLIILRLRNPGTNPFRDAVGHPLYSVKQVDEVENKVEKVVLLYGTMGSNCVIG